MKTTLATILIALALCLSAAANDNPADFNQTAHILGRATHSTDVYTPPQYNYNTKVWSQGSYSDAESSETDIAIGSLIYTVNGVDCRKAEVGKDYPVKVGKRDMRLLLPSGKSCRARIAGVREAQPTK
jgi:hypothetical protein